jgi:pimeloyl-ACP methyl ester carboxylesterase
MSLTDAESLQTVTNTSAPAELDLDIAGGRVLHAYDRPPAGTPTRLTVMWHHGTPNIGTPPAPLFAAADRLGIRWISYDRPGYGGSNARPGRDIASAATDAEAVTDALGIDDFAVMGHSGGSAHALACAALLGNRVTGAVGVSSLAPYGADGLDWFAGMSEAGKATLRAAAAGRAAKEAHEAAATDDDPGFTPADRAALHGVWGWFVSVVEPALAEGPGGLIDDDLAYVAPWGFDVRRISAPVLLLHGAADRIAPIGHARWLARNIPGASLWHVPDGGHISVLAQAEAALEWLVEAGQRS